jgi:hypothetical protein
MDNMVGADPKKLEELVKTALLIEQTTHDETLMIKVFDIQNTIDH